MFFKKNHQVEFSTLLTRMFWTCAKAAKWSQSWLWKSTILSRDFSTKRLLLISKSQKVQLTQLNWKWLAYHGIKKIRLLGRWLSFDEFHSVFSPIFFFKRWDSQVTKKSQWLVSAYFCSPSGRFILEGGDVVQIGTNCFFFEVTWYILIHFIDFIMIDHAHHKLHHTAETTAPSTAELGLKMICFHVKNYVRRTSETSDRFDSSSPASSLAFFSSTRAIPTTTTTTTTTNKKKKRCLGGPRPLVLRFFCKNILTHVDVLFLPKGEYSKCRCPSSTPWSQQGLQQNPPGYYKNDVEI